MKKTTAYKGVLAVLEAADGPLSVDELRLAYARWYGGSSTLASVTGYRILRKLTEEGRVAVVWVPSMRRPCRWMLVERDGTDYHHCGLCERVRFVPPADDVPRDVPAKVGVTLTATTWHVGLCRRCEERLKAGDHDAVAAMLASPGSRRPLKSPPAAADE